MIDTTLAEDKFFEKKPWRIVNVIMPAQNGLAPVLTPPHFANTIEILLTKGIEGSININENHDTFKEKSAYYIPPGAIHSMKYVKGGDLIVCFQINIEKLKTYINLENVLLADGFLIESSYYCVDFDELYKNITALTTADSLKKEIVCILNIFDCFHKQNKQIDSPIDPIIKKIIQYVEKNYQNKITLESISSELGYHKNYFSTLFKKTMDISFTKYLNNVRISHACNILQYNSMAETCEKCGFSDESYFIKIFKETLGITPLQYVKQIQKTQ